MAAGECEQQLGDDWQERLFDGPLAGSQPCESCQAPMGG